MRTEWVRDPPKAETWRTLSQRVAFGVSVCPFWWQWGHQNTGNNWRAHIFAIGPFRFAWRW